MIPLGIWMTAIGVADVVVALSGHPTSLPRAAASAPVAAAVAAILAGLSGYSAGPVVGLAAIGLVSQAAWVGVRWSEAWSRRRAVATAWGFAAVFALIVVTARLWPGTDGGWLARAIGRLPYRDVAGASLEEVLVVVGVLAILQATGNALVRLALAAIGSRAERHEKTLAGGRLIGPIERTLIFAFGLAGQYLAAAVIVSAKGLLRFPELTARARADRELGPVGAAAPDGEPRATIDVLTEYLLVGTLVSFALALGPLVLV